MNQRDNSTYELISAYLDGELSADEQRRAEQLLRLSEEHRESLEEMQSLAKDMQRLPTYHLDNQFAARVLVAAGRSVGAADQQAQQMAAHGPTSRPSHWRRWYFGISVAVGAAAALLLAFVLDEPPSRSSDADGKSVARIGRNSLRDSTAADNDRQLSRDAGPAERQAKAKTTNLNPQEAAASPGGAHQGTEATPAPPVRAAESAAIPGRGPQQSVDMVESPGPPSGTFPGSGPATSTSSGQPGPEPPPRIDLEPWQATQRVLLVIDVELTREGWTAGAFERLLNQEGVAFDANLEVESALQNALLQSRFFEPKSGAEGRKVAGEEETAFTIVYVTSRAAALDRVWRRMKQDEAHFANVSLDAVLQPGDMSVFEQLHQLGRAVVPEAPLRGDETGSVAHRLDIPPSFNGVPVDRYASETTETPVDPFGPQARVPGERNSRQLSSSPGGAFGGNVLAEAMFVLRTPGTPR